MRMRHTVKILGNISDADAMRLVARAMDEGPGEGVYSWENCDYTVTEFWNKKSVSYTVMPIACFGGGPCP